MVNLDTSSDHHNHQLELANNINLSSIFDAPVSSPFPYSYLVEEPNHFLDLLSQDHHQFASSSNSSSFSFDAFPLQNNNTNLFYTDLPLSQPSTTKATSSEVVNTATTSPNSTSVSSSSKEAVNDNTDKEVTLKDPEEGDQQEQKDTKPHSMYNNSLSMINQSSSDGIFANPGSSSFPVFSYDVSLASTSTTSVIRDHGLLQDILPSQIMSDTIDTRTNEKDRK
ncbi:hypothetical protein IGI04_033265 [Brassica rapa subsp. trilocularis]|uniref:Uncharacterized protein n=1 Tax=Brassica rapa subsp. trilocularis TaxID=1813537 RepID=A0ABQ7L5F0_BRACM|nr:hypothetical protein IGI04_033265 [Brassica rapa subsp. trilocularis]